jgi:hypothetical protein
MEFDPDWHEVVIEKDGELHRADIKTNNNLVLELQNSSISSETIQAREAFYINMVWLVNAEEFKEHFSIRSKVNLELKKLDAERMDIPNYEEHNYELGKANGLLEALSGKLNDLENERDEKKNDNIKIIDQLSKLDETYKDYLSPPIMYSSYLHQFKPETLLNLNKLKRDKTFLNDEIRTKLKRLKRITDLDSCEVQGFEDFKLITKDQVKPSSFNKCAFVEKKSGGSLFPKIIVPKSVYEFEINSKNSNFLLIVNLNEEIEIIQKELQKLNNETDSYNHNEKELNLTLKLELERYLKLKAEDFSLIMSSREKELNNLSRYINEQENTIKKLEIEARSENERIWNNLEARDQERSYEIKKSFKGLYTYNWAYRRKTWDFSNKKIYFDFGSDIWEKINDEFLRKLSKSEFIKLIKEHKK